mgnify:CR=1 FL=1
MRIIRLGNTAEEAKQGSVSTDQKILAAIFGKDGVPQVYEEEITYNTGDKIIYVDEEGVASVLQAKEDGITGTFDITKWREYLAGKDIAESKALMKAIFGTEELPKAYDSTISYVAGDKATVNGIVMIAIADTTGTYDATKWREFIAGDDSEAIDSSALTLKVLKNNSIVSSVLGI